MNSVIVDFQTRCAEVEAYFEFVLRLAGDEITMHEKITGGAAFASETHEELVKTLKASCFLLLYNLIESTMRNAVEAIFDELRTSGVHFDNCRDELRREILKNFKRRDVDKLLPRLLLLARDVVFASFERDETFSGNLDARSIRQTASRFGFAEPAGNKYWMLRTVRDLRNDLAHGVKSFADVGRNALPSELDMARIQTVDILAETIRNVDTYLTNKLYLSAPAGAATLGTSVPP